MSSFIYNILFLQSITGLTTVENKDATSTQGEAKLQVGPPSIKGVGTFAGNYDYSQFAIASRLFIA